MLCRTRTRQQVHDDDEPEYDHEHGDERIGLAEHEHWDDDVRQYKPTEFTFKRLAHKHVRKGRRLGQGQYD